MRVLILTRNQEPAPHTRLLAALGGSLVERGSEVAYLVAPVPAVAAVFSTIGDAVPAFTFGGRGSIGAWRSARRACSRFRPDVILVDDTRDMLLAALASPRKTGIVRRWRVTEGARWNWRDALASRMKRSVLLVSSNTESTSFPRRIHAVRAPIALPGYAGTPATILADPPVAPHAIACVPDSTGMATAHCLRSFDKLRRRHPHLELHLFGHAERMQAVRIHAAALGLAPHVRVVNDSALFDGRTPALAALWVASDGDDGALACVAGMQRGIPVVVDRNSAVASLVAHRITGLHADASELFVTTSALAQLLADSDAFRSSSEAARARAQRLHAWPAFVDRIVEAIEAARSDRSRAARSPIAGATA